ncbi:MAG: sulfite exporter TauE/SafE family protein [Deltaproteobacteria bacterium]|nr:sulfite exporter TauE/SafE family protein [Deltaproteobacteria bacterium]
MIIYLFALLVIGIAAGFLGALLGLGGGIIVVPALTLIPYFHMTIHKAIAISMVGVLATSLGGTSRFISEGFTDLKLGILLMLGTTSGAIIGSLLSHTLKSRMLEMIFPVVLFYASYEMFKKRSADDNFNNGYAHYTIGIGLAFFAGIFSGIFGVGGGAINVPVMHLVMYAPIKVATATSNFMIGATASAATFVYLLKGAINFYAATPVTVGVFTGAKIGSGMLKRINTALLKRIFAVIMILIALEMLYHGIKAYL